MSETWFRAIKSFSTYDRGRPFQPWIFGIATGVFLNGLRSLRVRGESPDARLRRVALDAEIADCATSVTSKAARSEQVRRLLELVEGLDEADRELVVHCGLEGRTAVSAAVLLGIGADAATKWDPLESTCRHASLSIL